MRTISRATTIRGQKNAPFLAITLSTISYGHLISLYTGDPYIHLTDAALKRAATLWAQVRNQGIVTADPKEIDGDALIAAQALEYQQEQSLMLSQIIVATTNVGHLSHFVPAKLWSEI